MGRIHSEPSAQGPKPSSARLLAAAAGTVRPPLEGSHRRLYTFSPEDYAEIKAVWGNGEEALPGDPPGELEVVEGMPDGGKIHELVGEPSAFTPDYAPEEMFEVAAKLYKKSL